MRLNIKIRSNCAIFLLLNRLLSNICEWQQAHIRKQKNVYYTHLRVAAVVITHSLRVLRCGSML